MDNIIEQVDLLEEPFVLVQGTTAEKCQKTVK
jgi:hypothetical protein